MVTTGGTNGLDPLLVTAFQQLLLQPLKKDWISTRFGPLSVQSSPENEHILQVFNGAGSFFGYISLKGLRRSSTGKVRKPFVILQMKHQTETLWYVERTSELGVLRWFARNCESTQDSWDGNFLESLREATTWCLRHSLTPQFEEGWQMVVHRGKAADLPFTVALCTATMNRLWQLKSALPLTLLHCFPYRNRCRVYVVDLGSNDGTLEWLLNYCRWAIEIGLLRVFRADELNWHACIGKNTAHIQAKEDILVNVDGDNLIGAGFLKDVCQQFQDGCEVAQYELGGGTCGRIALRREVFLEIGGYDEDAYPMGAQDTDLVLRVKALKRGYHRKVKNPMLSQAILNTTEQKIENCQEYDGIKKWSQMNEKNVTIFRDRRDQGQIRRNLKKGFIGVPVKYWLCGRYGEWKIQHIPHKTLVVEC